MDAILLGELHESQLVPDCTINEFLDSIREGFCGEFYIDVINKKARLTLFNDIVSRKPDKDLTPYLMKKFEKRGLTEGKQVKLSIKKELEKAASPTASYQEFRKKYPEIITDLLLIGNSSIYYRKDLNTYYKANKNGVISAKLSRLGSGSFDYDSEDTLPFENHEIPFQTFSLGIILASPSVSQIYAPIIGIERHLNTHLVVKTQSEDSTTIAEDDDQQECPIIFAFAYKQLNGMVGSHQSYHTNGGTKLIPSDENGLFNRYWRFYDYVIRNSFHQIQYKLRIPTSELYSFQFDRLKLINGQLLFPVSYRYISTDESYTTIDFFAKTVKLYGLGDIIVDPGTDAFKYFIGDWEMEPGTTSHPDFSTAYFNLLDNGGGELSLYKQEVPVVFSGFTGVTINKIVQDDNWHYQMIVHTAALHGDIPLTITEVSENPKRFKMKWDAQDMTCYMIPK